MPELSALLNFLFLASREDTVAVFWEIKAIGIEAFICTELKHR